MTAEMTARLTKAHSKARVNELEALGWTLSDALTEPGATEPYEYLLTWPHSTPRPFEEFAVVRVAAVRDRARIAQGTEGILREPRLGDIGTVVHRHPRTSGINAYEVECVGQEGHTIWLATFTHDELVHQ